MFVNACIDHCDRDAGTSGGVVGVLQMQKVDIPLTVADRIGRARRHEGRTHGHQ
jgi:hypothetical protein